MDKTRETAAKTLVDIFDKGAYANVALSKELRRQNMTDTDRRFLTELVYGAAKAGDTLDWILARYTERPPQKMPPMIRAVLRLGIYQLFFMDKVPPSAAVNEAVNIAKKYSHGGTVKFVNAVLRTASREPERARFPDMAENPAEHLALKYFHPLWLVKHWLKIFGEEECEKLLAFNNVPPPLSLRTNTLKISRDELLMRLRSENIDATASRIAPEGIVVKDHGSLDELSLLRDGFCQVQDESSMLAAHVLSPQEGEFVIDACAAPGGKTTHIAQLTRNKSRIIACDVHEHKLAKINENAARLGATNIEAKLSDARNIGEHYAEAADRILVDAPCSGFGVIRRKADVRRKNPANIKKLPALQLAILDGAAKALKKGGVLVYSTCTTEDAENIDVVKKFLASHEKFSLDPVGAFLPQKSDATTLQLIPHRDKTDGFFIARLKRVD